MPQQFVDALATQGITHPTPIQTATLPDSLAGRDVLGRGRTGSGKTYAFLLPMATRLAARRSARVPHRPRALILSPTRELATQIDESLAPLARSANLRSQTVFGGVSQHAQVRALTAGVDVLVACPGRLLDLMGQGAVDLSGIEVTILDEADHMADMGFLPMVRRILDKVPAKGQFMLFSATLDGDINVLVRRYLHSPLIHEVDAAEPAVAIDHHVIEVTSDSRADVLADLAAAPGKTIVFTRTKHGAKKLAKALIARGITAVDLHGNLTQNARTRNMEAFHSGRVSTLVATDIAARGIHVDDVDLVVHADPPAEHKAYLHRSGRTARAGKAGTVVTVVTHEQRHEVRTLMRAAKITPTLTASDRRSLETLVPGHRTFVSAAQAQQTSFPDQPAAQPSSGRKGGGSRRGRSASNSRGSSASRGGGASATATARGGTPARATSAARGSAARFSESAGRRSR